MLVVYVDDMIITGDDEGEITHLKAKLENEFVIKDLRNLDTSLRFKEDCTISEKVCARFTHRDKHVRLQACILFN
jgi:hypothetical protein